MKVLVVGSGGREHALCWAFRRSPKVDHIYCAPGNAGIAPVAECAPIAADDINALADFASSNAVDLTFVGGETSLALGIVDLFRSRGLNVIGPGKAAAQLESSKAFAKDFMARHGVPTAKYVVAHSPGFALLELESGDFGNEQNPVVVKADGLAAGKGVVVAANRREAETAINELGNIAGSAAAEKIVLEECLLGKEVSLLAFVNGEEYALMPAVRDHKRIGDGDTGPNTGGMGTFTDGSLLTAEQITEIEEKIIRPTLHGCVKEEMSFNGILFLGLMMTADGPKLLEYNVRFGDPETQAIMVRLETDLVDICAAMLGLGGAALSDLDIQWRPRSSACVVLASEGYPQKPRTGDEISGLDNVAGVENVEIFHAGTSKNAEGRLITAGGRVLGVTATGGDLASALESAYAASAKISWPGMQYRRDIGK
ncbi:MAG TPA: phosphoribosylamine--glycine ligase [Pyrinomonadaceae bacterium]|nr:phosphoribosylamine--glycine ligase [Pyrinomonadaceae bacterium]